MTITWQIAWDKQKCGNCLYCFDNECHRHAPKRFDPHIKRALWPKVDIEDWCGEWTQHPEA